MMPSLVSMDGCCTLEKRPGKEVSFLKGEVRKLIKLREALGYLENKLESRSNINKNKKSNVRPV